MYVLKSNNYLKFTGIDTFTFVDSLISNSVKTDKLFFSYLLGPDGKILNWFICETKPEELCIYQEIENLNNLYQMFNKYKIRINCDLQIVNENKYLSVHTLDNAITVNPTCDTLDTTSWEDFELIAELPSKKIIENGIIPNEVSWLDYFVDYEKGCFMGQEQTSRIKFRGRPRRLLKTTSSRTQVMEKI